MEQLKELENTFLEEYESADILFNLSKNKSVVILLSKVMFALVDYIIFKKYQKLPKNHTERFRILQDREYAVYKLVDEVWDQYTDAYSKPSLQESVNLLKGTIKKIVNENENISEKIKEIVK